MSVIMVEGAPECAYRDMIERAVKQIGDSVATEVTRSQEEDVTVAKVYRYVRVWRNSPTKLQDFKIYARLTRKGLKLYKEISERPITITVPVTFKLLNAPGWTHGHMVMLSYGTEFTLGKKNIGTFAPDPSGNPCAMMDGYTMKANGGVIWKDLREELKKTEIPRENPTPQVKRKKHRRKR